VLRFPLLIIPSIAPHSSVMTSNGLSDRGLSSAPTQKEKNRVAAGSRPWDIHC
jgi:hypothetical protein